MDSHLRFLFLEDSQDDYELEERELRRAGISFKSTRVENRADFLETLEVFKPHLVISDLSLPTFDGLSALQLLQSHNPEIPFIFVSGTIGEESAITSLKSGATDYVVKGRLEGFSGKVQRALAEANERSHRKELEKQFRQSQKMEAVGRLAGGIAHDFNNVLTVIEGYAQLVSDRMKDEDPSRSDLNEVLLATQHASALTRQLLSFSRQQPLRPVIVNVNEIVSSIEGMIRRIIGEDIQLQTTLEKKIGNVKADVGQIEQILMNFVVNSRDAMPQGGQLKISTTSAQLSEEEARSQVGAMPRAYVKLSVADTGEGIGPADLARIFEPFYTTKEQGKGTGLGLSTVYGIVTQCGGFITVASEPRKGAAFTVWLPEVQDRVLPTAGVPAAVEEVRGDGKTVLLAEDSEPLRRLIADAFRRNGYKVLEAADGPQALNLARSHSEGIHLLVSDNVMPGMGGWDLARLVAPLHPGIRILHMSGYSAQDVSGDLAQKPGVDFIQKPFGIKVLIHKAGELLGAKI